MVREAGVGLVFSTTAAAGGAPPIRPAIVTLLPLSRRSVVEPLANVITGLPLNAPGLLTLTVLVAPVLFRARVVKTLVPPRLTVLPPPLTVSVPVNRLLPL